jgi:hypothetical protein
VCVCVRERERGFCNRSKSYPQVTMISNIEQVDGKKKKKITRGFISSGKNTKEEKQQQQKMKKESVNHIKHIIETKEKA